MFWNSGHCHDQATHDQKLHKSVPYFVYVSLFAIPGDKNDFWELWNEKGSGSNYVPFITQSSPNIANTHFVPLSMMRLMKCGLPI